MKTNRINVLKILQKQYAAIVWISRPLEDKDFNSISSVKELVKSFYLSLLSLFIRA